MFMKHGFLTMARSTGLAAAARRATRSKLRILGYHGLWVTPGFEFGNCMYLAPEMFEARMAMLSNSGLPVLPLGEALDRLGDGTLPDAAVAITIDDGWVSTFTHMLPILEKYRLPATLYATTWYAGRDLPVVNVAVEYLKAAAGRHEIDGAAKIAEIEALPLGERLAALRAFGTALGVDEAWLQTRQFHIMSADELAEAHRRGLDVQLHTHRHIEIDSQVEALPEEIAENRAFLRAAIGDLPFSHFCYPSGASHPEARSLLAASGVRSATLVTPGLNGPDADPYALRRFLDGRNISDAEFHAYLSGVLYYARPLGALLRRRLGVTGG
jgi:peptidoglycan/xylan/chitin deacetylase (PgdA/CDA1 family)